MNKILIKITIIFIYIIALNINTYAEDINSEFGINEFLNEAEEYTEDIDIKEMLDSLVQGKLDTSSFSGKILDYLGGEVIQGLKIITSILVIIIIHSILKSVSESLGNNNVSKIVYYVQYILIVTIIMNSFIGIAELVKTTANSLIGFMNLLIPLLMALMIYTGNIVSTSIIEPVLIFMINIFGNLIQNILIPLTLIFTSLNIVSKLTDTIKIDKMTKLLKKGTVWGLGILVTIFVFVLSLQKTLSSSIDGITAKAAKSIVTSAVPVVGKILSDAVDNIVGSAIVLKNATGILGIIIMLCICLLPIIKLSVLTLAYKVTAVVCEPVADGKIISLIEEMGDIFKIFLAILIILAIMLIVGTTLVISITNSGFN